MARGYSRLVMDDWTKGVMLTEGCEYPYLRWAMNMTVTPQGELSKRVCIAQDQERTSANVKYIFVSSKTIWTGSLGGPYYFVQDDRGLYRGLFGSPGWTQVTGFPSANLFSTNAKIYMQDFGDKIFIIHPVDGLWVIDNPTDSTATAVGGNSKPGNCMAVWQNKLWTAGDPSNPERVTWSPAGEAGAATGASWSTSDWVDIKEGQTRPGQAPGIRALGIGNGMDVVGRGGLHVFLDQSVHLINDSTTGAYTTQAIGPGAAGSEAVTSGPDGVYCANNFGIWKKSQDDGPWDRIDDPIRGAWYNNAPTPTITAWCAYGRYYFTSATNNQIYEYVPETEAWFPQTYYTNSTVRYIMSAAHQGSWSGNWVNDGAFLVTSGDGAVVYPQPIFEGCFLSNLDPDSSQQVAEVTLPTVTAPNGQKARVRQVTFHGWYGDGSSGATQEVNIRHDWENWISTTVRSSGLTWTNMGAGNDPSIMVARLRSLGAHYAFGLQLTDNDFAIIQRLEANQGGNNFPGMGLKRVIWDMLPLHY